MGQTDMDRQLWSGGCLCRLRVPVWLKGLGSDPERKPPAHICRPGASQPCVPGGCGPQAGRQQLEEGGTGVTRTWIQVPAN